MTPMAAFVVGAAVPRVIRPAVLTFLAVAFLGGLVVYFGFRNYRFGRTVRDRPPEPARSVAMGRTEVEGETVPAGTVFDRPFTEGKCVYAEYEVQTYEDSDDDDGKEWTTTLQETVGASFHVDDGTGRVYVDPFSPAQGSLSPVRPPMPRLPPVRWLPARSRRARRPDTRLTGVTAGSRVVRVSQG